MENFSFPDFLFEWKFLKFFRLFCSMEKFYIFKSGCQHFSIFNSFHTLNTLEYMGENNGKKILNFPTHESCKLNKKGTTMWDEKNFPFETVNQVESPLNSSLLSKYIFCAVRTQFVAALRVFFVDLKCFWHFLSFFCGLSWMN